jgi:uncharacterized ion transporter superfamily protein YfcC
MLSEHKLSICSHIFISINQEILTEFNFDIVQPTSGLVFELFNIPQYRYAHWGLFTFSHFVAEITLYLV